MVNKGTMGADSLPKTVTRQRRDCDLNPDPSAPESSTLTTRLPSNPNAMRQCVQGLIYTESVFVSLIIKKPLQSIATVTAILPLNQQKQVHEHLP